MITSKPFEHDLTHRAKVKEAFERLQQKLIYQFEHIFDDKLAEKTVVIIPSLTLDEQILQKIDGINYYEERMLCLLMLLRMPRTRIVYVTSMPIDPAIIDYYLHLLPGITPYHAKQRLTFLSCFDASQKSLTEKILERPHLIRRIRVAVGDLDTAHITFFNVTEYERELAVQLQLPVYGTNPDLLHLGNKSNGKRFFRDCGIPTAPGFEDLHTEDEIVAALIKLREQLPLLLKAVIKINEGFSGEGNAIFTYQHENLSTEQMKAALRKDLSIIARDLSYDRFMQKFEAEGGIVEAMIDGAERHSPSAQCRITPLGAVEVISTHDQILGGEGEQVYLGASFPANALYARDVAEMAQKISEELKTYGVIGRFSIDFISAKQNGAWKTYAIEINLRKGGTTHPYLMLQYLTDGSYHPGSGQYLTASGQPRYYVCSDNLQSPAYRGLTPHDLIDIAMCNGLMYDGSTQEGVIFHLFSTLSQYGKIGVVSIATTPDRAEYFFNKTQDVLHRQSFI